MNIYRQRNTGQLHVSRPLKAEKTFCGVDTINLVLSTDHTFTDPVNAPKRCAFCAQKRADVLRIRQLQVSGQPDTELEILLQHDDEKPQEPAWLLVRVKSLTRPGLWGEEKVNADLHDREKRVMAAAMKIAEYQHNHYGDRHQPANIARTARECLRDIERIAAGARRGRGQG